MPIHDWTRVSAGIYHDFHQDWTIQIRRTLNSGVLPEGYYAMADQRVRGPEPDIIALLRLCDVQEIPLATNLATAEILLKAMERGELAWRETVRRTT